jgi:hypothetical protein
MTVDRRRNLAHVGQDVKRKRPATGAGRSQRGDWVFGDSNLHEFRQRVNGPRMLGAVVRVHPLGGSQEPEP